MTNEDDTIITNDEHIEMEEADISDTEATTADTIKGLREKIKQLEEEKRTLREESAHAKADFLNARRRLDEERIRIEERVEVRYAEELVPLFDSFALALAHNEDTTAIDKKDITPVYQQLRAILLAHGIESLTPDKGTPFNPEEHEALSIIETPADAHDTVQQTLQIGFRRKRSTGEYTLIRPARVVVGGSSVADAA